MTRRIVSTVALVVIVMNLGRGEGEGAQAGGPGALRPPAPITAVTVYPDRALVTRTARVDLASGTTEVLLEGLPGGLVDASVRATGKGTTPVKITGVGVSREHLTAPDDSRARALEAEIRALQDADRKLQNEIQSIQTLQKYLESLQVRATEQAKDPQVPRIDVEGIRGVFAFLSEGLAGLAERQQKAELRRRDLQERVQKLQRDLNVVRAPAAKLRKTVAVGLEAAGPGRFELQVAYLVPGAAWAPAYEVRALLDSGEVEMTYGARVAQQTGEVWEAVALALSTARPAVWGNAPTLDPWVLWFLPPQQEVRGRPALSLGYAPATPVARVPPPPPGWESGDRKEAERQPEPEEQARVTMADVVAGGPSVVFKIPRPATIPNDSREHKTTVAVTRSKSEFSYLAVPTGSPFAHLVARVKAEGEAPLLAGPVEVFMGGDYLGRSRLDAIAPGQTFDLHLGVDEGIKVRREEVGRERGEGGLFNKTQRTRIAYEFVVENFKRTAETISVMDRIPVAEDQGIEVGNLRFSMEPTERTERGILKWTFKLAPREKKVIRVEFTVTHASEKPIMGL